LNDEVAIADILEINDGKTALTSGDSDKHCEGKYSVGDIDLMNNSPDSKILWAKTTTVPAEAGMAKKEGAGDPAHRKVIRVTSITAKWTNDLSENALTCVSLDVKPGGLVAVIGPVGSGKVNYTFTVTCYSVTRC
jgi:ABC-type glutathione transport system ATPase component